MTRQDFHEQLTALVERGKAVHANAEGFMQTINEQNAQATASTEVNVQPEATTVVDEQPVVEPVQPQATQSAQPTVDAANIANSMDIDALVGSAPDIATPAQDTAQPAAAPSEDANSLVNGVDIDALLSNAPSLQQ